MDFRSLPVEVNSHIASFLETDEDICNFSLICRDTHAAVACDGSPLWRELLKKRFDLIPNVTNNIIRRAYQARRKALRHGASFQRMKPVTQVDICLRVLKDLILESYSGGNGVKNINGFTKSLNLQAIENFALSFDIIRLVKIPSNSTAPKPRAMNLMALQIMLYYLQFDLKYQTQILGLQDSQRAMYETVERAPIFLGPNKDQVNLTWVANAINFFKYHFTTPTEFTLNQYYRELPANQKVRAWQKPIQEGINPHRRWKGVYLYLEPEEVVMLRENRNEVVEDIFNIHEDENGPFQTLNMSISSETVWPSLFERHLQSISGPWAKSSISTASADSTSSSRTRAQVRAGTKSSSSLKPYANMECQANLESLPFYFHGSGLDADQFFACGWFNPLPSQQGYPGWQRMTMMKFFSDDEEEDSQAAVRADPFGMHGVKALNEQRFQESSLWAYEGVSLPGGQLIVGRWWSVPTAGGEDELYSGPFMFWCIDTDDGLTAIDGRKDKKSK